MELINVSAKPHAQRGFALVFTLIILVVMVLAAQAMMLMMRGGVTTAGNVAFRQAAVRVADVAGEDGYQWVNTKTTASATDLNTTDATTKPGYYATHNEVVTACSSTAAFAPQSYDFTNPACAMAHTVGGAAFDGSNAELVSNYALYYVVHRMAGAAGACPGAGCTGPTVTSTCPPGSSQDPSSPAYCKVGVTSTKVYYRITVKVVGPRHNSRYVQTFVY